MDRLNYDLGTLSGKKTLDSNFFIYNNKLTTWIGRGKLINSIGRKWTDKEVEVLVRFKDEAESFVLSPHDANFKICKGSK